MGIIKYKIVPKLSKSLAKRKTPIDVASETLIAVLTHPTRDEQAKSLNISPQALNDRLIKYKIREKIAERNVAMAEKALSDMHEMLPKVVKGLDKNLDSQDETVVLNTSKEILKRTMGDHVGGNTLVQNNIKIVTEQKEKYDL